jgi:hypothetical protein
MATTHPFKVFYVNNIQSGFNDEICVKCEVDTFTAKGHLLETTTVHEQWVVTQLNEIMVGDILSDSSDDTNSTEASNSTQTNTTDASNSTDTSNSTVTDTTSTDSANSTDDTINIDVL